MVTWPGEGGAEGAEQQQQLGGQPGDQPGGQPCSGVMPVAVIAAAFPFHFILNSEGVVLQVQPLWVGGAGGGVCGWVGAR